MTRVISPKITASSQKIILNNLEYAASIGIHADEKLKKQKISIGAVIEVSLKKFSNNDSIKTVVNYENIITAITDLVASRHFNLQETLVQEIANIIMENPHIISATISCNKLEKKAGYQLTVERTKII